MIQPISDVDRSSRSSGFTLVELIAVLVIIGIVSVIVAGRFRNAREGDLDAWTDTIKSHLRAAQARSMESDRIWGIRYTGTGYYLFAFDGAVEAQVRLPGEDDMVVDLSGSSVNLGTFTAVSFDSWGRPYANATASGATAMISIPVASGSLPANQIIITAETGFIP